MRIRAHRRRMVGILVERFDQCVAYHLQCAMFDLARRNHFEVMDLGSKYLQNTNSKNK